MLPWNDINQEENYTEVKNLLIDLVAGTIEKLAVEFGEASPGEKERLIKSSVTLIETFTNELKSKIGVEK